MTTPNPNQSVRFEPDEPCPPLVALGVGAQGVMLVMTTMVLIVAITARAAGQDDAYVTWAVFASLVIAGGLTALQASRFRRLGAGHLLIMGPAPHYIAVSVLALAAGGPALLASLTVAASLAYLMSSRWLPLLRRIITPVVSGAVLMLIAATVLPIALDRVHEVPDAVAPAAGPVVALVTLAVFAALTLGASGAWRVWSPFIVIAAGCAVAVPFGAYDLRIVTEAAWIGLPEGGFPGVDLTPGAGFWSLLPAFVVVALAGSLKNIGDCIGTQQVSWRRTRVPDFRLVQGSLNTNGIGILLSGVAGTPPTSVYSAASSNLIRLTGVASRRVGYAIGLLMVVLSLLPKVAAALLAIPGPVMAGYLISSIGMLFVSGIRTAVADGLDRGKALALGIAFAVGVGLDGQELGARLLGDTWGPLLDNGMVAGSVAAVVITRVAEMTSRGRQARLEVKLQPSAARDVDEFLRGFASGIGWDQTTANRLRSAGEETLMSLLHQGDEHPVGDAPKLIVVARRSGAAVEMEFLAVFDDENLADRLTHLSEESQGIDGMEEGEISLRLLRHYASSVHHQKFQGLDVVTVRVEAPG